MRGGVIDVERVSTASDTHGRGGLSRGRAISAAVLCLVYATPLFWPPGPAPADLVPDAGIVARLFPGVPPWWVVMRLVALAAMTAMLSGVRLPIGDALRPHGPAAASRLRPLALAVALLHAGSAPWASRLGPAGQVAYLAMLGVPALLLASTREATGAPRGRRRPWRAVPVATVIVVWIAARLATDLGSLRVADVVDGWRGFVDIVRFASRGKNLVTDLFDPELPGVGAAMLVFHGLPLYRAGLAPATFQAVQVCQIVWLAVAAAGLGWLTRLVVGPRVAVVAVAALLFAPYTRFVAVFPGPFLVGPLYGTAIALAAVLACRHRSEAAVAALGACAGIAVAYPGLLPTVAFFVAVTAWRLRGSRRSMGFGIAAGLASFAATVVPALANVLTPGRMLQHFRPHGAVALLEPALLGQLPVGAFEQARASMVARPLDVVVGALLEPFANARTSIRLWGDAIFDPITAAAIAIGLVACVRAVRRSPNARLLLGFFAAALCPAFVSPVDRVDVVHAVVLPVPAALLAALGVATLRSALRSAGRHARATLVAAVLVCGGGTLLFDVVNPKILGASSVGIAIRSVAPPDAARVVVLDYPRASSVDVRWLYTGAMTAYAGARPIGFLELPRAFAPSELAAEGKDLLFWSPGLERDLAVSKLVCAQWPSAVVYELADDAGLGHVHGARLGEVDWTPRRPLATWRSARCPAPPASSH
jgi:hypothetical protein